MKVSRHCGIEEEPQQGGHPKPGLLSHCKWGVPTIGTGASKPDGSQETGAPLLKVWHNGLDKENLCQRNLPRKPLELPWHFYVLAYLSHVKAMTHSFFI